MADIGADSTAIAWAIAKNQEQENSFQQQKKIYREGIMDGNGGSNDITEDAEQSIPEGQTPEIFFSSDDPNDEGNSMDGSKSFFGKLTSGVYIKYQGGKYGKIWLTPEESTIPEFNYFVFRKYILHVARWNADGTLDQHKSYDRDSTGRWWFQYRMTSSIWNNRVVTERLYVYNTLNRTFRQYYINTDGSIGYNSFGAYYSSAPLGIVEVFSTYPLSDNLEPIPEDT